MRFDDGATAWHVALALWRSIRLREDDKKKKKNLSITGFTVNGWVFDATLGSCCSEQRGGLCERAKAVSVCQGLWM